MAHVTLTGETHLSWILREFVSQIPSGMLDRTLSINRLVAEAGLARSLACQIIATTATRHWVLLRSASRCAQTLSRNPSEAELAVAIEMATGVTGRCATSYARALQDTPVIYSRIAPCHRYN